MTKTNNPKVLLREWLDVCAVYRVLHNISFEFFQKKTHNMAIPAIILTATGAGLAFSTQIFPAEATLYIPALVGVLNLIAGTFTSVSSFKKYAEQSEGHRVSSISFSKLSRKIKHKFVTKRVFAEEFLENIRTDIDALIEGSPPIPHSIVKAFREANCNRKIKLPNIIELGAGIELPNQHHHYARSTLNSSNNTPCRSPRSTSETKTNFRVGTETMDVVLDMDNIKKPAS